MTRFNAMSASPVARALGAPNVPRSSIERRIASFGSPTDICMSVRAWPKTSCCNGLTGSRADVGRKLSPFDNLN
jgi:hypothetical protein